MSFVFYDVETTGTHKHFDQILQFAAIRTDPDLNEIDRFEMRCRLLPHIVPSPGALRVTRVSIAQLLDPAHPTHYEMVCKLLDRLSAWSPSIFLGWNTIDFDEELLRQAFYQCLHPPYLTNTNGNARTDVLRVAQAMVLDVTDVLVVPIGDKGKPTFKLDRLAPANGFAHANAHDALADVEATIHIARLIRDGAPDHWSEALRFCSKQSALAFMEEEPAFIATECYFGKPYRYALTRLAVDATNTGSMLAYDLTIDPDSLRDLDDAALVARLKRSTKPVRRIAASKSPLLRDIHSVGAIGNMTPDALVARAEALQTDSDLIARLVAAAEREPFEESPHVEARIYGGFPCHDDQQRMRAFHSCDWSERAAIADQFQDERLALLARRLVYHHAPDVLAREHRTAVARDLACRMLGHDHAEPPWLTLTAAEFAMIAERDGCNEVELGIFDGLLQHLTSERARCEALL